jgi:speckle-type POZ protein
VWGEQKATKFFFKKPSAESAWISDAFSVTPLKIQLTFQIWIKFNTFGLGEMNVLVNQMTDMFLEQTNCDVQFHLPRDQKIGGHIFILSDRSDVFATMFKIDMQEAKTGIVVIKDIQPEIFKELMHFIYSGRTNESLTEETAQPLTIAAEKYDIKSLKNVRYLLTQIRADNAIDLLILGHLHSAEKLKNAALDFVVENFKTIFETDEWQELTEKYPELCLLTTRRMIESWFTNEEASLLDQVVKRKCHIEQH